MTLTLPVLPSLAQLGTNKANESLDYSLLQDLRNKAEFQKLDNTSDQLPL